MSQLSLTEIADRINKHLKRFEADRGGVNKPSPQGLGEYYNAGAHRAGPVVSIVYISYQGRTTLTRDEALAYLDWLEAGNAGRHSDAVSAYRERAQAEQRARDAAAKVEVFVVTHDLEIASVPTVPELVGGVWLYRVLPDTLPGGYRPKIIHYRQQLYLAAPALTPDAAIRAAAEVLRTQAAELQERTREIQARIQTAEEALRSLEALRQDLARKAGA